MKKITQIFLALIILMNSTLTPIMTYAMEAPDINITNTEEVIKDSITTSVTDPDTSNSGTTNDTSIDGTESSEGVGEDILNDSSKEASSTTTVDVTTTTTSEEELKLETFDITNNSFLSQFVITNEKGDNPVYLTAEEALFYIKLATSDSASGTGNFIVKINIPKEFVDKSSIAASNTNSQTGIATIEEVAENYVITYVFNNVSSGALIEVPIKFKTKNGETPNGYILPLGATISDSKGDIIAEDKMDVKYITQKPSFYKYGLTSSGYTSGNGVLIAGMEDPDNPGFLTKDITALTPVYFKPTINYKSPIGARYHDTFIIQDKLPEGAVFDPSLNPGWTYDASTNTAEFVHVKKELVGGRTISLPTLALLFPGAPLNKIINNTMTVKATASDKKDYEEDLLFSDDMDFTLGIYDIIRGGKSGYEAIFDTLKTKENFEGKWNISVTNTSQSEGRELENFVVRDYDLDNRMYYSKIELPQTSINIFEGFVDVIGVYNENGQNVERTIASNVSLVDGSKTYDLGRDVLEVIVKTSDTNAKLKAGQTLRFYVYSKFRDPAKTKLDSNIEIYSDFFNFVSIYSNYENSNVNSALTSKAYKRLFPVDANASIEKRISGAASSNYFVDDMVTFNLYLDTNKILPEESINFSMVDLLPVGFEYVANSGVINVNQTYFSYDQAQPTGQVEPKIINNYKGTGRTALIWDLLPFKSKTIETSTFTNPYRISYKTKITKYANVGTNENTAYLAWDSIDDVSPNVTSTRKLSEDIFDLNNNGRVDDLISKSSSSINFVPPREVITTKSVKGSLDQSYTRAPGAGNSELGGQGSYDLTVFNNSSQSLNNVTVLDILPYKGDNTVGISADSEVPVARGSEFPVQITGPVTAPAGYQVFYTTDTPTADAKDYTQNASWTTSPSDYSTVRAIKITLESGKTLDSGARVNFTVPFKVPMDTKLTSGMQAVNSFGTAVNTNLDYFESNNAPVQIVRYQVNGNLFEDLNENSLRESDETPITKYNVALVDENGNPVLGTDNQPMVTQTDDKGYYEFDVLSGGNYRVKVITPKNYALTKPKADQPGGSAIMDVTTGLTDTFSLNKTNPIVTKNAGYIQTAIIISGEKTWDDANNQDGIRPDKITVNLLADDVQLKSQVVKPTNGKWTYSFNDLPVKQGDKKITYTVTEEPVTGYKTKIEGFNITNTHTPAVAPITVKKVWDDTNNQDGLRPDEITIRLMNGTTEVAVEKLTEDKGWAHTFKDIPVNEGGKKIQYTVTEDKVDEYETKIDGFTITNKHVPAVKDIEGKKVWNDANNQDGLRPDKITINLLADGNKIKSQEVTPTGDKWTYAFKDVPVKKNGKEITYTVTEEPVAGYETKIEGYTITNTHTPAVAPITVKKVWDDTNNQDGLRPQEVTVRLMNGDTEVATEKLTEDKGWEHTFKDLPVNEDGKEIIYTVTEDKVDEYETKIDGFTITNKHVPAVKDIEGEKTWDDANNQDGIRPKEVTVRLMNGDTEVAVQKVSEATDWKYSFKDVPVKKDGEEITYTVTEDSVDGYENKIEGFNITNTHTPAVAPITVKKVWDDTNNQDGLRPQEVTVRLMNGDTEVATEKLTEDKGWEHTFKDIPVNEGGKEITYTVTEDAVDEYETKIDGFTITNKHVPAVKDIEGEKTWDDANNQDGIRPKEVIVRLMNGDTEVAVQKVSEATDWKYSFKDVPVKQNGKEINYTVTEDAVEGYETMIDGFNITNRHVPGIARISGQKIWDDAEDQDGIRPDEITVRLLADGEEVDKQTVTASNDWTYTFENAPMRKDGQLITYGVSEDPVTGYETMIDGYTITNKLIQKQTPPVSNVPKEPTDKKRLPITGEASSSVLITLAGGILLTGIGIIVLRKKQGK
ncbi:Cna B-type domain-containing protein [Facklamia sp. 7083-14-GEN3]|uniref:Cna B-type domain-containing protein n=1 Tax=Facklamia sp. 7083-14-GEN3 TaxID=2973478 RepID=UPI00215C4CDE|nr:Cna B-type domain-containing protein [Facklamia sp. 7083-14-GEN3]MCR8968514.1 Cna B-type domain-containing protein [Facklamia sp. 7083-14-GEN3]